MCWNLINHRARIKVNSLQLLKTLFHFWGEITLSIIAWFKAWSQDGGWTCTISEHYLASVHLSVVQRGHSMSREPNFQHFWTWPSQIFFKFGSSHVSPQIVKNLNFLIFMNCTFQVTVNWKQQRSSFFGSCAVQKIYYYS